ncbi:MAG: ABC transporter permease, partial [Erysipelotrichaceae bacterium]|nr:ABC transporter permease [Erysipelotrichaceae bacterium]
YKSPTFLIKSNMFSSMIEFEDGEYKIVDGRFYNDNEINSGALVCVISENLAEYNGVRVGDDIVLSFAGSSFGAMQMDDEETEAVFEVIGIFSHNHQITPD